MIAVIDNYDSFTYNLVQMLAQEGADIEVLRNDSITPEQLEARHPQGIVISPGPGTPEKAGRSKEIIRHFTGRCPILGVCLGHQSINEVFGGKTVAARKLMHGKTGSITLHDSRLFEGLDSPMQAGRYHSLEADPDAFPDCLQITAEEDGEIMALEHRDYPVYGVQFHPESILTPQGIRLLRNFLGIVRQAAEDPVAQRRTANP